MVERTMPDGFRDWLARIVDVAVSPKQAQSAWNEWQRWEPHVPEGECSTSDILRKVSKMLDCGVLQFNGTSTLSRESWVEGLNARADLLDGR